VLETLNIFGVHADYMKQFKEYLEEEGLPANENRLQFILPVIPNLNSKKLKMPSAEGKALTSNGEAPSRNSAHRRRSCSRQRSNWTGIPASRQ